MSNLKIEASFLTIAGLIGLFVGGSLLFFPAQLQADNGIILSSASHFSEARAPGAAIFCTAILAFISVFRISWRQTALILMALFFLAYGFGRLLSLFLDGMPTQGLFYAMIGELIMGVFALIILSKMNPSVRKVSD